MNYWWVNQNQTWKQEISGGFMWSPKKKRNGASNHFYDNMRKVDIGDLVFSFFGQHIQYLGVVTHPAASGPKPAEFGSAGDNWNYDGWIVPVSWTKVPTPYRPKDRFDAIKPHLPQKYSPLNPKTGSGQQMVYLASVADVLAEVLLEPFGAFAESFKNDASGTPEDDNAIIQAEVAIEQAVINNTEIDETEKEAIVKSRRGQGRFRTNLMSIEKKCRITGVSDPRLLKASHIKPWRACETNSERLDGNNGLLLSPSVDHLFDNGFITFADDGQMILSTKIAPDQLEKLGIMTDAPVNVGKFSSEQAQYLRFHRENIFG